MTAESEHLRLTTEATLLMAADFIGVGIGALQAGSWRAAR